MVIRRVVRRLMSWANHSRFKREERMWKQDFVASGFKPLVGRVLLWWSDGEQGTGRSSSRREMLPDVRCQWIKYLGQQFNWLHFLSFIKNTHLPRLGWVLTCLVTGLRVLKELGTAESLNWTETNRARKRTSYLSRSFPALRFIPSFAARGNTGWAQGSSKH